jgi:hypothetical protein
MPARTLRTVTGSCPCGAATEGGCRLCRKCRSRARWRRRLAGPHLRSARNARRRRTTARLRSRRGGRGRP